MEHATKAPQKTREKHQNPNMLHDDSDTRLDPKKSGDEATSYISIDGLKNKHDHTQHYNNKWGQQIGQAHDLSLSPTLIQTVVSIWSKNLRAIWPYGLFLRFCC